MIPMWSVISHVLSRVVMTRVLGHKKLYATATYGDDKKRAQDEKAQEVKEPSDRKEWAPNLEVLYVRLGIRR
jgi:hypothetical protein